jgi:hypothetical protein
MIRECDHPAPCGYLAGCVHQSVGWPADEKPCWHCGGSASDVDGSTCPVCGGHGTVLP